MAVTGIHWLSWYRHNNLMQKLRLTVELFLALTLSLIAVAAEDNQGFPGTTSTGYIQLSLQISDNISAGVLHTNLDSMDGEESEFRTMLSTELVQSLKDDSNTTIPFCVLSSGGGSFELTSYEIPGEGENTINSEFGTSVPVSLQFGNDAQTSVKYRSLEDECTQREAIPVTIQLNRQLSGEAIGRIYGRLNVLVKSE